MQAQLKAGLKDFVFHYPVGIKPKWMMLKEAFEQITDEKGSCKKQVVDAITFVTKDKVVFKAQENKNI